MQVRTSNVNRRSCELSLISATSLECWKVIFSHNHFWGQNEAEIEKFVLFKRRQQWFFSSPIIGLGLLL